MDYDHLSAEKKLRVNAHIIDYFRDTKNGFAEQYFNYAQEQAHNHQSPKQSAEQRDAASNQAVRDTLHMVRDYVASHVDTLAPVKSNNITSDMGQLNFQLAQINREMVEDINANREGARGAAHYAGMATLALETIRKDENSHSDLRIPAGAHSPTQTIVHYMKAASDESKKLELLLDYGAQVSDAALRIDTHNRIGDHKEAAAIAAAVKDLTEHSPKGGVGSWFKSSEDIAKLELQQAVHDIRQNLSHIPLDPTDVQNLAHAAVNIVHAQEKGGKQR